MKSVQNLILGLAFLALSAPACAQTSVHPKEHPKASKITAEAKPAAGDASAAVAKPGEGGGANWAARCSSATRGGPLDCSVEQSAVLTKTGQLIVVVNIRTPPAEPRSPVILVQIPLGVFLPGGVLLQVDNGGSETLALQTCEQRGCFAGGAVSADLLKALTSGQNLKVSFQDLQRQTLNISMPLGNFASAYEQIK